MLTLRVCRVQELVKYTPETHEDYSQLTLAERKIGEVKRRRLVPSFLFSFVPGSHARVILYYSFFI
jgi:hypothetical protein